MKEDNVGLSRAIYDKGLFEPLYARLFMSAVKAGQTEYEHIFKTKMDQGSHAISNVDVLGVNRDTINITAAPAIDDGKNMYFKIHLELPAGYGNEKARLIVQPAAVDCLTEDILRVLYWNPQLSFLHLYLQSCRVPQ